MLMRAVRRTRSSWQTARKHDDPASKPLIRASARPRTQATSPSTKNTPMKSNDARKEKKKAPLKTAKEKKLAKAEKKNKR